MKLKLGIFGYARHGKDTVAGLISDEINCRFCSSSMFALEKVIYPHLSPLYGYRTMEDCFDDRVNHRAEWKNLITHYNSPDKARLAKDILKDSDIYVGMRCKDELNSCIEQKVFDLLIWVKDDRKPEESLSSCTIRYEDYIWDFTVHNDSDLLTLQGKCVEIANCIRGMNGINKN